jgi:hypothetical protein
MLRIACSNRVFSGLGAEEAEKIPAAVGVEGEGGAGERRVNELVVGRIVVERFPGEIVKCHWRVGKETAFRGALHQDEEAGVASIVFDGVGQLGDGGLFAFMKLPSI